MGGRKERGREGGRKGREEGGKESFFMMSHSLHPFSVLGIVHDSEKHRRFQLVDKL
jgi:hypothetical protein